MQLRENQLEILGTRRMEMFALPTEVICGGILPHLSVCDLQALDTAFTNKYLRPQLRQVWKCYQYDSANAMLKTGDVSWLRGVNIRIISLTVNYPTELDDIITSITRVKKVRLEGHVYSADLECLAANCPDLEELCVKYVGGRNIDNAVSVLAQNCRQLHTLRISSKELTDAGISSLSQYANQLHTLRIGDARTSDAGIQALCDNCPHLKHIELSYCHNLTDASLIAIANSYPLLQNIIFLKNSFTCDGLIYFANKCHELRSMIVKYINITSRGLTALWTTNPNLVAVDISCNSLVTVDDIIQLLQCCPLLQRLNISKCYRITDAAVSVVAEHCPQLRSLHISDSYKVFDASLIALGQHCHELKSIDISYLQNISDVGIAALAAGCPLLQEFYASDTNITDAGVIELAHGCRDLRIVYMSACKFIGIAAVSAIAENCPLVSELYIQNCQHVNDACLYIIAQHCRYLTVLKFDELKISNVAAVKAVIKSCRMLRDASRLQRIFHEGGYTEVDADHCVRNVILSA